MTILARSPRRTPAAVVALIWALITGSLALSTVVNAAPLELSGHDWEGSADLVELARAELGADHVVVANSIPLSDITPKDALLLIHPTRPLDAEALGRFMRDGGRVAVLDDFGASASLIGRFGMQIVPLPERPKETLRDRSAFALAEPASNHPLARNLNRVVTNHAVGIKHPDLSTVLQIQGEDGASTALAVAGSVGNGRLVAVGDSSLLMNSMLRYAGNRAFAIALIHYTLEEDAWGARGGKLYVLAGDFTQQGTYGESDARSELASRVHALLDKVAQQGIPKEAQLGIAIALACSVVLWVLRRASKTYHREVPRYASPTPVFAQGGVAGHTALISRKTPLSNALAMVEWKRALEEKAALSFGIATPPSTEKLLALVDDHSFLSREEREQLRKILLRMSEVETLLLSGQHSFLRRVKESEVISTGHIVNALLKRFERKGGNA